MTHNVYQFISSHLQMNTELVPQPVLSIPKNVLENYKNSHPNEFSRVVDVLGELFHNNKISFPWKKLFFGDPLKMMESLKKYQATKDYREVVPSDIRSFEDSNLLPFTFDKKFLCFIHQKEDYHSFDVIVDYFQEAARLSAKRSDAENSPLGHWQDEDFIKKVIVESLQTFQCVDPYSLRVYL